MDLENLQTIQHDVFGFLEQWCIEQDETVQPQLPLMLFPASLSIGFAFIEDASNFSNDEKILRFLKTICEFEAKILDDVKDIIVSNNLGLDIYVFSSPQEASLAIDGLHEDLMHDVVDWFNERFHDEFAAKDADMSILLFKMVSIGMSIIEFSFNKLVTLAPENHDFGNELLKCWLKSTLHFHQLILSVKD